MRFFCRAYCLQGHCVVARLRLLLLSDQPSDHRCRPDVAMEHYVTKLYETARVDVATQMENLPSSISVSGLSSFWMTLRRHTLMCMRSNQSFVWSWNVQDSSRQPHRLQVCRFQYDQHRPRDALLPRLQKHRTGCLILYIFSQLLCLNRLLTGKSF